MIKLHQKPDGSTSFVDHEGLTISVRLKLVDELSSKIAYFKLLKRFYLIELYRQISGLCPIEYKPMEKSKRGNSQFREESKPIQLLLLQFHFELKPGH